MTRPSRHFFFVFLTVLPFSAVAQHSVKSHSHATPAAPVLHEPAPASGFRVDTVAPGSTAAAAELMPGDVIVTVDGKNVSDLLLMLRFEYKPGARVMLQFNRNNQSLVRGAVLSDMAGGGSLDIQGERVDLKPEAAAAAAPKTPAPAAKSFDLPSARETLHIAAFPALPATPADIPAADAAALEHLRAASDLFHELTAPAWKPDNTLVPSGKEVARKNGMLKGSFFCEHGLRLPHTTALKGSAQVVFSLADAKTNNSPAIIRVREMSNCDAETDGLLIYPDGSWSAGKVSLQKGNLEPQPDAAATTHWSKGVLYGYAPVADGKRSAAWFAPDAPGWLIAEDAQDKQPADIDISAPHTVLAFLPSVGTMQTQFSAAGLSLQQAGMAFTAEDASFRVERPATAPNDLLLTTKKAFAAIGPAGIYHVQPPWKPESTPPSAAYPDIKTVLANAASAESCPFHPAVPKGWVLWGGTCTNDTTRAYVFSPDGAFRAVYYRNGPVVLYGLLGDNAQAIWTAQNLDDTGMPKGRIERRADSELYVGPFHGLVAQGDGLCQVMPQSAADKTSFEPCSYAGGQRVDTAYLTRTAAERLAKPAAPVPAVEPTAPAPAPVIAAAASPSSAAPAPHSVAPAVAPVTAAAAPPAAAPAIAAGGTLSLSGAQLGAMDKSARNSYKHCVSEPKKDPGNVARSCVEIGHALQAQKDDADARTALQRACTLGSAEGCNGYGSMIAAGGDISGARAVWTSGACHDAAECNHSLFDSYAKSMPPDLAQAEKYGLPLCDKGHDDKVCTSLAAMGSKADFAGIAKRHKDERIEEIKTQVGKNNNSITLAEGALALAKSGLASSTGVFQSLTYQGEIKMYESGIRNTQEENAKLLGELTKLQGSTEGVSTGSGFGSMMASMAMQGVANANTVQSSGGNLTAASFIPPSVSQSAAGGASPAAASVAGDVGSTPSGGGGGASSNGPQAQWVQTILPKAGPYNCSPKGNPKIPAFQCNFDADIYKAEQISWAMECEYETGYPDDAVKLAPVLLQVLQEAKSLCTNAFQWQGGSACHATNVIPCSQLPN